MSIGACVRVLLVALWRPLPVRFVAVEMLETGERARATGKIARIYFGNFYAAGPDVESKKRGAEEKEEKEDSDLT